MLLFILFLSWQHNACQAYSQCYVDLLGDYAQALYIDLFVQFFQDNAQNLAMLTRLQALARAVYARCEIVLLDDPLSALDGKTESSIVENLLGPQGLFRKTGTTVFLMTNSGKTNASLNQR